MKFFFSTDSVFSTVVFELLFRIPADATLSPLGNLRYFPFLAKKKGGNGKFAFFSVTKIHEVEILTVLDRFRGAL